MLSRIKEEIHSPEPLRMAHCAMADGISELPCTKRKRRTETPPQTSPFHLKEPFFTEEIFVIDLLKS